MDLNHFLHHHVHCSLECPAPQAPCWRKHSTSYLHSSLSLCKKHNVSLVRQNNYHLLKINYNQFQNYSLHQWIILLNFKTIYLFQYFSFNFLENSVDTWYFSVFLLLDKRRRLMSLWMQHWISRLHKPCAYNVPGRAILSYYYYFHDTCTSIWYLPSVFCLYFSSKQVISWWWPLSLAESLRIIKHSEEY